MIFKFFLENINANRLAILKHPFNLLAAKHPESPLLQIHQIRFLAVPFMEKTQNIDITVVFSFFAIVVVINPFFCWPNSKCRFTILFFLFVPSLKISRGFDFDFNIFVQDIGRRPGYGSHAFPVPESPAQAPWLGGW